MGGRKPSFARDKTHVGHVLHARQTVNQTSTHSRAGCPRNNANKMPTTPDTHPPTHPPTHLSSGRLGSVQRRVKSATECVHGASNRGLHLTLGQLFSRRPWEERRVYPWRRSGGGDGRRAVGAKALAERREARRFGACFTDIQRHTGIHVWRHRHRHRHTRFAHIDTRKEKQETHKMYLPTCTNHGQTHTKYGHT